MVAGAFDHRDGAGIAHGEAFAGDAAEIAFALDRAVQHGVADDDRLLRHDARVRRRAHHDAAAGKALADIVVGVAVELEGDAAGEERAEALAGRAGELRHDGVVRQAVVAVALGDFARQHGAGGAVGVPDRQRHAHRRAVFERGLRLRDQLAVDDVVDLVILLLAIDRAATLAGTSGLVNSLEKSSPFALACAISLTRSSICICPIISLKVR